MNKIITRCFILLCSLIITTNVYAQPLPALCHATTLTLPEMVQLLRANNPQIGAVHYAQLGAPPAIITVYRVINFTGNLFGDASRESGGGK